MLNPKTTISGYLLLAGSVLMLAAHALTGTLGQVDITAVMTGLAGIGLVLAKDGGH